MPNVLLINRAVVVDKKLTLRVTQRQAFDNRN
jgi:hypothetical protein